MALAPGDPRHGTVNGYVNLRCRCDACTEANRISARPRMREWRARNIAAGLTGTGKERQRPVYGPDGPPHGRSRYMRRNCRCDICVAANSDYIRARSAAFVAQGLTTGGTPRRRNARAEHGTWAMYNHHNCRCDDCRAAGSAYNKLRKARQRGELSETA